MIGTDQKRDSLGNREEFANITLDCYLSSILTMAECIEAACPAIGVQYSDQLVRIRRRVAYDHSPRSVVDARDAVENTLAAYAHQANRYCEHQLEDLRQILDSLAEIEELAKDGPAGLLSRIEEIRKRLLSGKETPSADKLTGLANRRELERQVKLRLATEKRFCVLLFDIDDFGLFNESLGRLAGDQILKQAAERLNAQIRANDLAARWVADEFVVLIDCDMDNARRRSVQMAEWLRGPYTIIQEDGEAKLEIRVSAAVAECGPGDTPRQIWLRLEDDFHQQNDPAVVA